MENKHGSIFVGMIKGKKKNEKLSKSRLLSFKEGMQELPKRLAESLIKHPILGFKIKEVKSNQNGQWWVRGESEEGNLFENLLLLQRKQKDCQYFHQSGFSGTRLSFRYLKINFFI